MNVSLECDCGRSLSVSEGSAGMRFPCECGRTVAVPSLGRLRELAGLPAVAIDPVFAVEAGFAAGTLPPAECVGCGRREADTIELTAVCERIWTKNDRFGFVSMLCALILGRPRLFHRRLHGPGDEEGAMHGRDTAVRFSLPVCDVCRADHGLKGFVGVRRQTVLKRLAARVPAYDAVLKKYPGAVLERRG